MNGMDETSLVWQKPFLGKLEDIGFSSLTAAGKQQKELLSKLISLLAFRHLRNISKDKCKVRRKRIFFSILQIKRKRKIPVTTQVNPV